MRLNTTTMFLSCLAVGALAVSPGCGEDDDPAADTAAPADTAVQPDTVPDTAVEPDVTPDTADTSPLVPQTCGAGSALALAGCVEMARLSADLDQVAVARPSGSTANATVRALLAARLETLGYTVELDDYGRGVNVIGKRTGKTTPNDHVVISAHYDSVTNCAGADDNGTGVVGALEAARILATAEHDRTLVVAFWDEEEIGLLGSYDWTDRMARAGSRVVVSLVFEMLGYTSDAANSQTLPDGFEVLFPDVVASVTANGNRGDFIALIADASAAPYTSAMAELGAALGHSTIPLVVPATLMQTNLINDLRRSDHAPFWAYGWPAMMITDTANFRNPNYHCAAGPDAVTDLDFDFAAKNVAIGIYAAGIALSNDAPTAGVPANAPACDLVAQTGCPEGKRCTVSGGGAGLFQTACLNVPATPVGPGGTCSRPTGIPGEDNCAAGHYCSPWGKPTATPPEFWCRSLCVADSDCANGEDCQAFLGAAPGHGVCLPTCDPFAENACATGANCIAERANTERTATFGCARLGTVAAGGTCSMRSDNCVLGAMCAPTSSDGVERCGEICDDTHPCGEGKTCEALPNLPADLVASGRGTCQPVGPVPL